MLYIDRIIISLKINKTRKCRTSVPKISIKLLYNFDTAVYMELRVLSVSMFDSIQFVLQEVVNIPINDD